MSDEIDIDIFGAGNLVDHEPDMVLSTTPRKGPEVSEPPDTAADVTATAGRIPTTPPEETIDTPTTTDTEVPYALIFRSKSGGPDHVVIQQADAQLACTCWPGTRRVGRGCHAMVAARLILGLPEPDEGPP